MVDGDAAVSLMDASLDVSLADVFSNSRRREAGGARAYL